MVVPGAVAQGEPPQQRVILVAEAHTEVGVGLQPPPEVGWPVCQCTPGRNSGIGSPPLKAITVPPASSSSSNPVGGTVELPAVQPFHPKESKLRLTFAQVGAAGSTLLGWLLMAFWAGHVVRVCQLVSRDAAGAERFGQLR